MNNPTPQPAQDAQATALPSLQWVPSFRCQNCGHVAAQEPEQCPKCLGTFFVIHTGRRLSASEELSAMADRLRSLIPHGHTVHLEFRGYDNNKVEISVFGLADYAAATDLYRHLGIKERHKTPWNDVPGGRTSLVGRLSERIGIMAYCDGLPPSCRLEKVIERVPKSQTVTTDEFVEIERVKIVCGHEHQPEPQPTPVYAQPALEVTQ